MRLAVLHVRCTKRISQKVVVHLGFCLWYAFVVSWLVELSYRCSKGTSMKVATARPYSWTIMHHLTLVLVLP